MAIFTRRNAIIGYAITRFAIPMVKQRARRERERKRRRKRRARDRASSDGWVPFTDDGRFNLPEIPGVDLDIDWSTHARRIADDKVAVGASASLIIGLAAGTAVYMLHRQMRDRSDQAPMLHY